MLRILFGATVLSLAVFPAFAQNVANRMTCAQAVSAYAKDGRILIVANGKNVIPIYGWTPLHRAGAVQCGSRNILMTLMVKTTDSNRCAVAVRCQ